MAQKSEEDVAGEAHDVAQILLHDTRDRIALFRTTGLTVPPHLLLEYQTRLREVNAAWERWRNLANEAMAEEVVELAAKFRQG